MRILKDTSISSGIYSWIFVGRFHWVQRNWIMWNVSSVSRLDYKELLSLWAFLKNSVHTQISLNILYCITDLTGLFTFITLIMCLLCRCVEPSEWILDWTLISLFSFFITPSLPEMLHYWYFFQNMQILLYYIYVFVFKMCFVSIRFGEYFYCGDCKSKQESKKEKSESNATLKNQAIVSWRIWDSGLQGLHVPMLWLLKWEIPATGYD